MSRLQPTDRTVLASAVVDTLSVFADPDAPESGLYYWECARPYTAAVAAAVREHPDPAIREHGLALLAEPSDPDRYRSLRSVLLAADDSLPATRDLFDLGWRAECNNRLGHHFGADYDRDTEPAVTAEELAALPVGVRLPAEAEPAILIVVPFRDRSAGGGARLRNLMACLLSLRDQSYPRDRYRVTVVESDDRPRWRDVIAPLADHYLFAPKGNTFNKSWAVNAGVVNSPGDADVICILDADVLTDRDFVARNAARFEQPGRMGHLPYRNMLCLDYTSTARAIRQRLHGAAADADLDTVRGFYLRRGPGCCLWVRSEAFQRVGGMDERYEGWGGEDIDFNYRFDFAAAYDQYDDCLLHMRHPPASALTADGDLTNAHIPPLSWDPVEPIGVLERFSNTVELVAAAG
jgi:hypothetical protein